METPSVREYATEAIRYWELRRVIDNLVLVAVVVAYFAAGYPASKQTLTTDSILVSFLSAVVADMANCAAYLVDIFAQISGFRELWRSARWILFRSYFCSDLNAVCLYRKVPSPNPADKKCYSHPLMRAIRAASTRFPAPSLLMASER
jgi:hypothetical protein